jgi:hypothetical protein
VLTIISDPVRQIRAARSVIVVVAPILITTLQVALVRLDYIIASYIIALFAISASSFKVLYNALALKE